MNAQNIFLPKEDFFFIPSIFIQMEELNYVSLITTQPNTFMKKIHIRMPVILNKKEGLDFLKEEPIKALEKCLPLSDKVKIDAEIAGNLLTEK